MAAISLLTIKKIDDIRKEKAQEIKLDELLTNILCCTDKLNLEEFNKAILEINKSDSKLLEKKMSSIPNIMDLFIPIINAKIQESSANYDLCVSIANSFLESSIPLSTAYITRITETIKLNKSITKSSEPTDSVVFCKTTDSDRSSSRASSDEIFSTLGLDNRKKTPSLPDLIEISLDSRPVVTAHNSKKADPTWAGAFMSFFRSTADNKTTAINPSIN